LYNNAFCVCIKYHDCVEIYFAYVEHIMVVLKSIVRHDYNIFETTRSKKVASKHSYDFHVVLRSDPGKMKMNLMYLNNHDMAFNVLKI
jgi:hypothetical protein